MDTPPKLPIPISMVGDKFLLFDIDTISWLRVNHNICGVMGGTLWQSPSQNVFLGLPIQIMPEEAQLLVEKGVGFITDSTRIHEQAAREYDSQRYSNYMAHLRSKQEQITRISAAQKEEERRQALSKQKIKAKKRSEQQPAPTTSADLSGPMADADIVIENQDEDVDNLVFGPTSTAVSGESSASPPPPPPPPAALHRITPTTSEHFLPPPLDLANHSLHVKHLPKSYPLYRHLNERGYFQTPGIRFGCQYCVYPGDPLRFHSHFLAVGVDWDEEIDLMDVVGGGRLGTGVKKGWLIGGQEPAREARENEHDGADGLGRDPVKMRVFTVEWAAM